MRRPAAAALLVAALAFAGCAAGDAADGLSGGVPSGGLETTDAGHAGMPDADGAERLGDVPPECLDAFPYLLDGADFADMDAPAGWPAAPTGATLCMTSSGDTASASFVTELPFDEVAAHYEAALAGAYETSRATGADNGTGYASLDGWAPDGAVFQVREHDAGFVLVLSRG